MSLEVAASVRDRDVELALEVADGETVALLGPNGSGKSTLLNVVAGLLSPDAGSARLNDRVLYDVDGAATQREGRPAKRHWLRPDERGVAMLAQEALLFPHLTARENVAFGPRSSGHSRRDAHRIADAWLERVGATALADRHPDELSGGQAQRIAVARALAVDPSLLLLDEPMAALDVSVAPAMRRLLRHVLADRMAVIVTHNVLDALMLADRIVLLEAGRIVDAGPTRSVLERPSTPFAAALTGLNLLTGVQRRDGLVETDEGHCIAATSADAIDAGARVGVCVRPSRVRVLGENWPAATERAETERAEAGHAETMHFRTAHAPDATIPDALGPPHPVAHDLESETPKIDGATNVVTALVTDLEPQGDSIRVRADRLAADVAPGIVADLDLMPGSRVRLAFEADDAVAYPI